MGKVFSSVKTARALLVFTILLLVCSVYLFGRPISYGAPYNITMIYEDEVFQGSARFYSDGRMVNGNSNFDEAMEFRYYYKNGYVFYPMADNQEEYEEDVAYINDHFEEAVNIPFYASKINAFHMVSAGMDGYQSTYICDSAVIAAVICSLMVLTMGGLTVIAFKKSRNIVENTME